MSIPTWKKSGTGLNTNIMSMRRLSRDFFGEMSIIDGEARSATATAVTDCLLLRIDKADFQELLSTYNSAAVSVVRALNQRLREVLPDLERAKRGM